MRRLLLALLLVALPAPAWAVIALTETAASFGQTSSSSPFNFALFTAGVTPSGALLTCAIRVNAIGRTVTFSDSQANTWVTMPATTTFNSGGDEFFTAYALNASMPGSSTLQIQAAVSGAGAFVRGACLSHSGIATSSALDQTNHNNSASGTTADGGSITTTCANEVLILYTVAGAGGPATGGGGFTDRIDSENDVDGLDRIVSATGTYTGTAAYGAGAIYGWGGIVMSFADTTAPCSSTATRPRRGRGPF